MMFMLVFFAASAVSSGEPPHAPNVCSNTICLEVLPAPHPSGRGLVRPTVRTWSQGESSLVELSFPQLGVVVLEDMPSDSSAKPDGIKRSLLECERSIPCRTVLLSVKGAPTEQAGEQLKCQILSIWTVRPNGYGIVGNTIAIPYQTTLRLEIGAGGKCEGKQIGKSLRTRR